ncbi:MAG: ATP-binding cassette domain-containing protein [Chloroflexi bacterium]|nr:ATP-binding cassette domain-containing protein [Chloroflexota bacterium]
MTGDGVNAPRIDIRDLTIRHLGRKRRCLEQVSLTIAPGERVLIAGPSGAGKSTLALCLNGLVPHSVDVHWVSGSVDISGEATSTLPPGDLTRRIGILFQDPDAQVVLSTIDEDIAFGLENRGIPPADMPALIARARLAVGLARNSDREADDQVRVPEQVDRLSGGARQRLTLAGLLAGNPDVLVLDEPVANLDPVGAATVWATVAALLGEDATRRQAIGRPVSQALAASPSNHQGTIDARNARHASRSLIVIEHTADDVLPLLDRVIVLDQDGRVALCGTPDDVFIGNRERVRSLGTRLPVWASVAHLTGSASLPRSLDEAALAFGEWTRRTGTPSSPVVEPEPQTRTTSNRAPLIGPRIALNGVSFRHRETDREAVSGVTLTCAPGELIAIVGANGAGKSTLGLMLAGVVQPTAGKVLLDGTPIEEVPAGDQRRRLRYVFQHPEHQFVGQTVRADLEAALRVEQLDAHAVARRVDDALRRADLEGLARANPFTLSHGQKRRLSVAGALLTGPDILVLDEPTFGQDDHHTAQLMATVNGRVADGCTAIVITHDLDLVACHATRVIAMREGSIIFDGTPAELLESDPILRSCSLRRPPAAELAWRARRLGFTTPPVTCRRDLELLKPTVSTTTGGTGFSDSLNLEPIVEPPAATPLREPVSMGAPPDAFGPGPRDTWLERRNPTVKFGVVIMLGFMMTFVFNPLTPLAWLAVIMVVAWTTGIRPLRLARLLGPVTAFAFSLLWTNAFLAAIPQGEPVLWQWGPFHLTVHGVVQGFSLAMRGVSTAAVGLLFILTTDPTLLVVSLVHHGRLPYQWGYALLAGYRFMPGLADELVQIRLARRVRGEDVTDERGIHGTWGGALRRRANGISRPFGELRILLTVAILRATRLAIAMDARGFAGITTRTYFRTAPLTPADPTFAVTSFLALTLVYVVTSWIAQTPWVPPS